MSKPQKIFTKHIILLLTITCLGLFSITNCGLGGVSLETQAASQNPKSPTTETITIDNNQYLNKPLTLESTSPETGEILAYKKTFPMILMLINYLPIIFLLCWWIFDRYINSGKKIVHIDR